MNNVVTVSSGLEVSSVTVSKGLSQTYTCIHSPPKSFPFMLPHNIVAEFPVLQVGPF